MTTDDSRRTGDTVQVPGDYQYRVSREGLAPQRFWHKKRFAACEAMLAPDPGDRILDIGCGSGVFADLIASQPEVRVVGVDGNLEAIAFARSQYGRPDLQFEHGLLDELEFEDESFHRISLLEVIEHIYPAQARLLLGSCLALLKPGGRLVISTPNRRSLWPLLEWTVDRLRLVPTMDGEQHVADYDAAMLRDLGESAGLTLVETRRLFTASPWLTPLSWRLGERVHSLEQRLGGPLGALLVQSFDKPMGGPRPGP